jgi:hypothetical protein
MNNPQQLPLPERLKKGAAFLGQLWKDPTQRCIAGWTLDSCTCEFPTKFCKARMQWISLAIEQGRDLEEDPHGLALAMTATEWDATGLTMKVQHPQIGEFKLGSSLDSVTGMVPVAQMMHDSEVLASTLRVMRAFPKSKYEGMEEAPIAVVVPEVEIEANPDEAFE